jgi:hypothetical protein
VIVFWSACRAIELTARPAALYPTCRASARPAWPLQAQVSQILGDVALPRALKARRATSRRLFDLSPACCPCSMLCNVELLGQSARLARSLMQYTLYKSSQASTLPSAALPSTNAPIYFGQRRATPMAWARHDTTPPATAWGMQRHACWPWLYCQPAVVQLVKWCSFKYA